MPTPLQDKAIVQVTWWQTYQSQILLNTLHYEFNQIGGAADYESEMNALFLDIDAAGAIGPLQAACCSTGWSLEKVVLQPVYPTRLAAITAINTTTGPKAGTQAPASVAGVVTKRTALAARYGIGAWHQGGLIASDVANGVLSASLKSELALLGAQLLLDRDGTNPGTFSPVLWNIGTPTRRTYLTNVVVQPQSRVMRRRTVGLGI